MTEAKFALIQVINDPKYQVLIERIKKSVENHEPISELLAEIKVDLEQSNAPGIKDILETIERSNFQLLDVRKMNEHPSICAVDTFLPVTLLLNPTNKMREAAGKISAVISQTLKGYTNDNFIYQGRDYTVAFERFAKAMIFESSSTYPGAFKLDDLNKKIRSNPNSTCTEITDLTSPLSSEQMKFIMEETITILNDPNASLRDIMLCHANYGYELVKSVALRNTPKDCQSPVFDQIRSKFPELAHKDNKEILTLVRNPEKTHDKYRKAISDDLMYDSALYQQESGRGRGSVVKEVKTNAYGLIRGVHEGQFRDHGLKNAEYEWVDWTNCEFKDESIIVNSMVKYETPFISSFSGTTSLLMSVMIQSGVLQSPEDQQIYLQNTMAYIVSSGFHSIHEIVAPATYCLKLIDPTIYPVELASNGAKIPQYYSFYQLASKNDPEFEQKRQESWQQLMQWYQNVYQKQPYLSNVDILDYLIKKRLVTSNADQFINSLIKEGKEDKKIFKYLLQNFSKSTKPEELAFFDHFKNESIEISLYEYGNSSDQFKEKFKTINKKQSEFFDKIIEFTENNSFIEISISGDQFSFQTKKVFRSGYDENQYFDDPDADNAFKTLLKSLGLDELQIKELYDKEINGKSEVVSVPISDPDLKTHIINRILLGSPQVVETNTSKQLFAMLKEKMNKNVHSNTSNVLKEDEERGRLVFSNENKIYKWKVNSHSFGDMNTHLESEKKLFELVNPGKTFSFNVEKTVSYIEMSHLGEPLSKLMDKLTPIEIDRLLEQATNLVKTVHQNGFVYGDVSLDNFIYDEKTKKLYLVDFESSKKLENGTHVALSVVNKNTLDKYPEINPEQYKQEDDFTILHKLFRDLRATASEQHKQKSSFSGLKERFQKLINRRKAEVELPKDDDRPDSSITH